MSAGTVALLRAARKKIAVKKRWTQGAGARTSRGRASHPWSRGAVCWCAIGAVDASVHASAGFTSQDINGALDLLDEAVPAFEGNVGVPAYNNAKERKHKEILALYDHAILAARSGK